VAQQLTDLKAQDGDDIAMSLTSQRLKEDEDRAKYHSKTAEYGTDGVRGRLRVGNQIEECEAHHQEDNEPFDPRHVGLLFFRSSLQIIRRPCCVYSGLMRSFL
jgi:hypothetical protein